MTTISHLHKLEELYDLMKKGMISEDEYNSSREDVLSSIFEPSFTSLSAIEEAARIKEKQIITEEEFERIKQQALNKLKPSKESDEDNEDKKRNRIYTIILIILIVVPPACSITFFPSPLGALATVGWLLFVAFGAIKTWWNVYGPGKILEKHIVSEGVRMGRKRR